jgi:hypothetical protein
LTRPLEIDSDSSIEEFEDALNVDEDIFAEPVPQNRLKYLSMFVFYGIKKIMLRVVFLQLRITLKKKSSDLYSSSLTIVTAMAMAQISSKEL